MCRVQPCVGGLPRLGTRFCAQPTQTQTQAWGATLRVRDACESGSTHSTFEWLLMWIVAASLYSGACTAMEVAPSWHAGCRAEKNWAFFEHQGRLLFFYSMLPCSLIHRFDPASPKGAELLHAYCYAGAEMVRGPLHLRVEARLCCKDLHALAVAAPAACHLPQLLGH